MICVFSFLCDFGGSVSKKKENLFRWIYLSMRIDVKCIGTMQHLITKLIPEALYMKMLLLLLFFEIVDCVSVVSLGSDLFCFLFLFVNFSRMTYDSQHHYSPSRSALSAPCQVIPLCRLSRLCLCLRVTNNEPTERTFIEYKILTNLFH